VLGCLCWRGGALQCSLHVGGGTILIGLLTEWEEGIRCVGEVEKAAALCGEGFINRVVARKPWCLLLSYVVGSGASLLPSQD